MSLSTDFVLPGYRLNPKAHRKADIAKAFAHSRLSNRRNLEAPWYGLWCNVLTALTANHSRLLTIPQFVLYYVDSDDSDDATDAGDDADLANTTIDTITSFGSTIPEKSAVEVIPDFAIVRVMYRRNPSNGPTWRNIKVKYAGVPLLAEVKRFPPRVTNWGNSQFLSVVTDMLLFAKIDAWAQARYCFRMHARQKTVILIACTGPWWSCRLCHKNQLENEDEDTPLMPASEEEETVEDDTSGDLDRGDESDDELDIISIPEDSAGGGLLDEDELTLPDERWTDILQLGTPASNQRLYIISQRLEAVLADNTGIMG